MIHKNMGLLILTTYVATALLLLLSYGTTKAQTALTYGDVVVSGWNNNQVSSNRQVQFLLLKDCDPGTVFKYTLAGFNNSGTANSAGNGRVSAGISKWTNGTGSTLPMGTVLLANNNGGIVTFNKGTAGTVA